MTLPTIRLRLAFALCFPCMALSCKPSAAPEEQSEQAAVEAIQRLGGRVEVDEGMPNRPVVKVSLMMKNLHDEDLQLLSRLPSLRVLYLDANPLTDEGLHHLTGLSDLENLDLGGTDVTDDGLKTLSKLSSLQRLVLNGTKVKEERLGELRLLQNRRSLHLVQTPLPDES